MIYSNNDTLVTESEFLDNPEVLVKGTVDRKANLVIFDDDTHEVVVWMNYKEFIGE